MFLFKKSKTVPDLKVAGPKVQEPIVQESKVQEPIVQESNVPETIVQEQKLPDPLEVLVPAPLLSAETPTPTVFNNDELLKKYVHDNIIGFLNRLEDTVMYAIWNNSGKCQSNIIIPLQGVPIGNSIINEMITTKINELNTKGNKYVHLSFTNPSSILLTIDLTQIVADIKF